MMTSPQMAEMIRSRSLDIGFLTGAHLVSDLTSATLLDERLVCVLPKGHRLAGHAAVDVRDLADEAFVMGARTGWDIFLEVVDRFCGAAGFRPRIVQEADYSNGIVGWSAPGSASRSMSSAVGSTLATTSPSAPSPQSPPVVPPSPPGTPSCARRWSATSCAGLLAPRIGRTRDAGRHGRVAS